MFPLLQTFHLVFTPDSGKTAVATTSDGRFSRLLSETKSDLFLSSMTLTLFCTWIMYYGLNTGVLTSWHHQKNTVRKTQSEKHAGILKLKRHARRHPILMDRKIWNRFSTGTDSWFSSLINPEAAWRLSWCASSLSFLSVNSFDRPREYKSILVDDKLYSDCRSIFFLYSSGKGSGA